MERLRGLANDGKYAEYAPNSLQFKGLCLSFYDDLNLPAASFAFREIINSAYGARRIKQHPVIAFMASRLPSDFLTIESEARAWSLFKPAYEQVCDLIKQGHFLPQLSNAHISDMHLPRAQNKSVALVHLSTMRQRLGV